MAGIGEACSHIGATLYAVKFAHERRESMSCTEKENAWLPPTLKHVECMEIRNYSFQSAKRKLKDLNTYIFENPEAGDSIQKKKPEASDNERTELLSLAMEKGLYCLMILKFLFIGFDF